MSGSDSSYSIIYLIFEIVFFAVYVIALWKLFVKANQPGWAALIPFYNAYMLVKIAGKPGWWFVFFFVPIVNIIVSLLVAIDLAKAFGKSSVFGVVGLWFFSIIGYMILAFGSSKYVGSITASAPAAPQQPPAPTPTTT